MKTYKQPDAGAPPRTYAAGPVRAYSVRTMHGPRAALSCICRGEA